MHDVERERLIEMGHLKANIKIQHTPTYFGNGDYGIAMTRCIGNGYLKQYDPGMFLSTPDVIQYEWTEKDKYLILCSDGLYDECAQFDSFWNEHAFHKYDDNVMELAEDMCEYAVDDEITGDNVSVIVVQINLS